MNAPNNTFLVGHTIELRVPSVADMEHSNWHSWYNSMSTTENNMHGIYPISVSQEVDIIRNIMNKDNSILCSIYDLKTEKIIGNAALQNIDLVNRHCNLALTIGEEAPFTTGVEVFGLLCTHAFMRLNLERVYDSTHENLITLVTMLSVLGFKEEGIMEKFYLRNNRWYSKVTFGLLKENFLDLQSKRFGKILFENKVELQRAVIDAVKRAI